MQKRPVQIRSQVLMVFSVALMGITRWVVVDQNYLCRCQRNCGSEHLASMNQRLVEHINTVSRFPPPYLNLPHGLRRQRFDGGGELEKTLEMLWVFRAADGGPHTRMTQAKAHG